MPVDQLFLTASTSEAYSWVFKLLCNPGDEVLVPEPAYPLLEVIAALEGVTLRPYQLVQLAGEWVIDTLASGASAPDGAYVMANGSADPALVAAIERRGVRQVLDSQEEARAIANGWRAPAN